jgi:hypothetical protein
VCDLLHHFVADKNKELFKEYQDDVARVFGINSSQRQVHERGHMVLANIELNGTSKDKNIPKQCQILSAVWHTVGDLIETACHFWG